MYITTRHKFMGHCLIPLEPWVFWLLFPKQNFHLFLPDFLNQNNELFNEIVKTEKGAGVYILHGEKNTWKGKNKKYEFRIHFFSIFSPSLGEK